jgi:HD superfamily phosphohydrolase
MVHTIYGDFTVTEPVLIDLFNSPIMERIKHVRQYGVLDYIIKQKKEYTRYEHCVGVWALLRMYGATLEEQIAGLLHDSSHTVFSHVGDVLFDHQSDKSSYQDDIHEWYLQQYNVDALLAHHNIALSAVLHKSGTHVMLERDLPDICADRLEYNLQAGLLTSMLTIDDITAILQDIRYAHGQWFFVNKESAKQLALVSLFNTEHVWSSPANQYIYHWTADALSRALTIGLLTIDDIHFSTDPIIWDKLWISNDECIIECLDKIVHYRLLEQKKRPISKGKFRGLNPLIQENDQLKRLTDIDTEYYQEYNRVKEQFTCLLLMPHDTLHW